MNGSWLEEEEKKEGGWEEVVGSVGLDLTNDVEAHSRQSPVTPSIAGQAGLHHHTHWETRKSLDCHRRADCSSLRWIYRKTLLLVSVILSYQDLNLECSLDFRLARIRITWISCNKRSTWMNSYGRMQIVANCLNCIIKFEWAELVGFIYSTNMWQGDMSWKGWARCIIIKLLR